MVVRRYIFAWLLGTQLMGNAAPPAIQTLIDFTSESSRNWASGDLPAQLDISAQGAELKLDFKRDDQQITLTRPFKSDLKDASSFRFRLGISQPTVLLEGTVSFKSGNGWYTQNFTLHERGATHLLFTKEGCNVEGTPQGWNQIEAIRFSFWPREKGQTILKLYSLEAFQDTLWVIDTESLAQTADETYTSRVSLRHMDRLLKGLGLPHAIKSTSELQASEAPSLVIVPYLPNLPPQLYRTFGHWKNNGTHFIVFESGHQGFAKLLGVGLGSLLSSSTVGQFDHVKTDDPSNASIPSTVFQHAWSLHQIRPLARSQVTSQWATALGDNLKEPGSIETPSSVWLNVAWRSGDLFAKQLWLGEWIGRMSPELLTESLRFHHETASPQSFEIRNGNIKANTGAPHHLKSMAIRNFEAASQSGRSPLESLRSYRRSDQLMQRAFASDQEKWKANLKGIWDQNGTGFYAGSWDKTCKELKAAGFNAVFPNMASAGRAHYPSRYIPPSKSLEKYGDQLKAFTTAAHKHGLEAHAWKICWKLNTRLPAFKEKMRREGRLMQDTSGKTIPWLSISHPKNVQFEINSLLEMAGHAPIDGIHLDYMRYPGREADYGPAARKSFEAQMGRTLPNWPKEVLGPLKAQYQSFRQQEIHRAMHQISSAVKAEFPRLTLSVAVWGAWPDCADAQGQDWPVWAKEGWVDWIIPMNYTDNPDQFAGWLDLQRAQPGVAERLLPGIGLISSNAELSPAQLLTQLHLVKDRNLPGAILYRLDSSLETRLFPYLKLWK